MNIGPIIFSLAGFGLTVFGFRLLRKGRTIENTPTSKIRSLAMGQVEIKGKAVARSTYTAPLSKQQCVYYRIEVQERRERKQGKQTIVEWVTIASDKREAPFFIEDETGKVLLDPKGADVDVSRTKSESWTFTPPESLREFLAQKHIGGMGSRRCTETCILPGDALYVFGDAGKDGTEVLVRKGGELFLISDKSERAIVLRMKAGAALLIIAGLAIIAYALAHIA